MPCKSSDSLDGKKKTRSVSKRWANRSIFGLRLNSKSACLTGREWCKVLWRDLEHGHLWFHCLTHTDIKYLAFVSIYFHFSFFLFSFLSLFFLSFSIYLSSYLSFSFSHFKDIVSQHQISVLTAPVGITLFKTHQEAVCCFPVTACLEASVSVMRCGVS